ncbi:SMP-30/gluconolactonase/LRE family protein [Enterobacter hormaechei]|uniref:SMP-30/gluconolactonase/LRE family protein n=1 Tax=Enterobacter cloacae complex TaxID=354276 RepID=UPI00079CB8C2|nr:SMP-30/gluconolactonase/LRE family protein [Enterobacter hormaechei]MDO2398864.1 SMP-30/gluconolactonase/LRE family protein [Enterobacter hormaechei]MDO2404134.1 SMP-30/gluconolactonase/LRE family protein [Enterobacter hormaechei]MDO2418600.1 SMP-30/gluconolactonase/LRE family protein [Enterobacter hormaechei]MDO2426275.1 SMP-30/gluconolactonase/LRE family protein [Enterobacter hormaechei]CZY23701.1 SMP-30/gluconolaconase/LRE domain-containing protein [Enterobacter hormaechei]
MSLFTAPSARKCKIFSSMPENFYRNGDSDWVRANKPGQKITAFIEGPTFDRNGDLYVTDIPYGRIFRIDQLGVWSLVVEYNGWPNGLAFHRDGRLFIADYRRGILALNPSSPDVSPILTHIRSESFKGVNDLFFDESGRLYFTDQGQTGMQDPTGRVYRFEPEANRIECLLSNGPSPNGLLLDHEGKALLVAMTRGNAVWRLPVTEHGPSSKVGIFTAMAGGVSGADGMGLDAEGNVYVCDAGHGCVWIFSRYGVPLFRYDSCTGGRTLTNIAFGGQDNATAFVTDSSTGTIQQFPALAPGRRLFSHT